MALKAKLKNLDGLDEALKVLYKQDEKGGFVLDVESVDGFSLEDVAGLKSTVSKTREELKAAKEALKGYSDEEGNLLDATKARDALGRIDDLAKAADPERVKAAVAKQLDEQKAESKKLIDAAVAESKLLESQLHEVLVDRDAMTALSGKTDHAAVLLPHVKSRIRIDRQKDGKRIATVVDEFGNPQLSMKQGSSDPMAIDEFVESMSRQAQFSPFFRGSGASGGDTEPGTTRQKGGSGNFRITAREAESNPRQYQALREQAQKAGQTVQFVD